MTNPVPLPLLSQVRIASPCPARWEDMTGDDRTRHCAQCGLDVHNLSAMTGEEAEALLREKAGRLCAGFYRREDGTVLTQDCPTGLALLARRTGRAVRRVVAAALCLVAGGATMAVAGEGRSDERLRRTQPFRSLCAWLFPAAVPPGGLGGMMLGVVCPPPVPVPPPGAGGAETPEEPGVPITVEATR